MKLSLFIDRLSDWDKIKDDEEVKNNLNGIFCGDYGCDKRCPSTDEIILLNRELAANNIQLHYISPKVSQALMEREREKILTLLKDGIDVSVNDLGLLYSLYDSLENDYQIYLGRLLTKSIADWVWSDIFLSKENDHTMDYLYQNNFNEHRKMRLFQQYGIIGIEVNIHKRAENSYKEIQRAGFKILGYADNSILSVSRSCPILRNIDNEKECNCSDLCRDNYRICPSNEKQRSIYPYMELRGNVIYTQNSDEISWNGFDKLIYTWKG